MLVRARVVGAVPYEELPSRHPPILGGELGTPTHVEQTHFATPHCHLHHSSCVVPCWLQPTSTQESAVFLKICHFCVKLSSNVV